ncbi:hypothetical protein [Lactobacillus curvatus] [Lactiplantibacillus mudanjiangensis]|uniref:hypothetical protein n=1 Tax=Lactiplantibacillus mudanjiangensis TaxID=1296538 RepID=UPI001014CDFE|nr:hypothetical protein [Lactobacillus curvatus] [Lactiplantibacillus mudanjiangensis]
MENKKECPIDHTELTPFNQYDLQDGTICRECAKTIGLIDNEHNSRLAKAAKALLTVRVATDYISNDKSLNSDELLQAYSDEFSSSSFDKSTNEITGQDDTSENTRSMKEVQTEPITEKTDKAVPTKKEPIFWKGDGSTGFGFGVGIGLGVGIINILFLHIPWLGRIVFIACWLIIGHSKSLSDRGNKFLSSGDNPHDLNKHPVVNKEPKRKQQKKEKQVIYVEKKEPKKPKVSRKVPHCPKCKSTNIQILDNKRKFSAGKTIVGGVAFSAAGAAVGAFAGKKGKKYHAVCMQCGKKFLIKI